MGSRIDAEPAPRALFWTGGSLWIGRTGVSSDYHAHHAIQLGLGISSTTQFRTKADADWVHYNGVLIPSNLVHTFRAPGELVANLFCDPESQVGRLLKSKLDPKTITPLDPATTRPLVKALQTAFEQEADAAHMIAIAQQCFTALCDGVVFAVPTDVRITAAIDKIHKRLDSAFTLGDIARAVHLSESRFRHLFVSETGLHFRGYVLWARLNRAMELGFSGVSWTEAAHAAHFSDAAHLTRTCQRMFGFAPTHAQKGSNSGVGFNRQDRLPRP